MAPVWLSGVFVLHQDWDWSIFRFRYHWVLYPLYQSESRYRRRPRPLSVWTHRYQVKEILCQKVMLVYKCALDCNLTIFNQLLSLGDSNLVTALSSVFDFLVIFISVISLLLTSRSLIRGQKLRKVQLRNSMQKYCWIQWEKWNF